MKRFATICSGIGAPEQAAKGLDWKPVFNAERVIDGSPSLTCNHEAPILFAQNTRDEVRLLGDNIAGALSAQPGMKQQSYLKTGMAVRRLTPRECERLQGFPDNYTLIEYNGKPAKDAPRYKALGNSMAVPVIRWILNRIDAIDEMKQK